MIDNLSIEFLIIIYKRLSFVCLDHVIFLQKKSLILVSNNPTRIDIPSYQPANLPYAQILLWLPILHFENVSVQLCIVLNQFLHICCFVWITNMRSYTLMNLDKYSHLCCYLNHNVSSAIHSSLLQVLVVVDCHLGILSRTISSIHGGSLFLFCFEDIFYHFILRCFFHMTFYAQPDLGIEYTTIR